VRLTLTGPMALAGWGAMTVVAVVTAVVVRRVDVPSNDAVLAKKARRSVFVEEEVGGDDVDDG